MPALAALVLASREWLWPVLAASATACALIAWAYARSPATGGVRLACAWLKLLGIAALLLCVLEPMWMGQRAKPGANLLAIVADNSQSMMLKGRDKAEPRGEALRRVLTDEKESAWRTRLARDFEMRGFLCDSRLQATQDFHELAFDGHASSLGQALRQLGERYRGQPLAGVVLLTDGVASDLAVAGADLRGLPPIYPVVFGQEQPAKDLAVANPSVSQTSFEDAPITVQAEILAAGFAGEEVVVKLVALDAAETAKPVAEQTLRIPPEGGKLVARFQFRPEKSGVLFYRIQVAPKVAEEEATLANNETSITVDRAAGPYRVLYVGGRPNWEYKFLHRALQGDDQTELVGLIRIAKREPKFEFRGRAGESSNPLFRGFGDPTAEEVERYDQPVLLRLNTEDEFELRGGFPKSAEELFRYHAVVLDDLESEFFTAEQRSLLQRFVAERGGGFLMLGGVESFVEGKFQRTPIGELLPIYLDRKPMEVPAGVPLRLALTREGWLQPWARMRATESDERQRLATLPHFDVLNAAGGLKPAASVLATVNDGERDHPALVSQRFGRGRAGALLIGDFWHAGLGDETLSRDLGKAWRQTVRWLVADVPLPIEVRTEPPVEGDGVRLTVRVRDRKFQALDNAVVHLQIQSVGSATAGPVTLRAEPSPNDPGLYETVYFPRENGGYRVEATVADEAGAALGKAQAGWNTDLAAAEFRSLVPNRALMESLARQTGGRVLAPEELEAFADELPSRRAPVVEAWTRPLWHTPWMFLLALACFVAEWGVRRWKGLT